VRPAPCRVSCRKPPWRASTRSRAGIAEGRARRIGLSPAEDSGTIGAVSTLLPGLLRGSTRCCGAAKTYGDADSGGTAGTVRSDDPTAHHAAGVQPGYHLAVLSHRHNGFEDRGAHQDSITPAYHLRLPDWVTK